MLLERIEARTLPEALDRVSRECGPDALVVETKQTRTGYLVLAARRSAPRTRDQAGSSSLSSWPKPAPRATSSSATWRRSANSPATSFKTQVTHE